MKGHLISVMFASREDQSAYDFALKNTFDLLKTIMEAEFQPTFLFPMVL